MRWLWIVAACLLSLSADARVVLVGIDGGSWNVIDPLIEAGELPNLAAIARDGVTAELETVEPVTSPVVWTSIATGRSPATHGVTDFFATRLDVRVPTVFERLSARGLRVGLYDYLMTWPPAAFDDGFVIPGWLRRDDTTTPKDVWSRIALEPWAADYTSQKTNEDYRVGALREVELKAARWNAFAAVFNVDVGAVTFYAVDGMSHRFWHGAYPDEFDAALAARATEPERSALFDALHKVDQQVGEIRAALSPGDTILIVSDHGFHSRGDARDVWVSNFGTALARAGLDPTRDGFTILSEFGSLSLRVHPGDFEQAERTTERLVELIESHTSEDGTGLFWGAGVLDVAERPPGRERSLWNLLGQWILRTAVSLVYSVQIDPTAHAVILALPRGGTLSELWPDGRVQLGEDEVPLRDVFSRQMFTGEHDEVAIFLAAGGPIAAIPKRGRISVLDVAPLIFHLAGSPVPDDLEGSVPTAWITEGDLQQRPVRTLPSAEMPGIEREQEGSMADDPDLVEKLRRLGYIE